METFPATPEALAERLSRPTHAGSPTGEDARLLPAYELVRMEIVKTRERDCEMISRNCFGLLTEVSSDCTLWGYFLHALAVTRGWSWAATAAGVYADQMARHGEEMFPQRERAKLNALRWLIEPRVLAGLEQIPVHPGDYGALCQLTGALTELDKAVAGHFPDAPSVRALTRLLESRAATVKPIAVIPPAAGPAPPFPSPSVPEQPVPAATYAWTDAAAQAALQAAERLQKLAEILSLSSATHKI